MSKVMKWRYKGQADIIFGEVKPSPVPKIMFVVIISIVVLSSISCFLLRNYLYDLAFNPHIELNLTQENENYYIDLNVNETFDKFAYIDESRTLKYDKFISDEDNKYVCEVEGEVDTTHVGEYNIIYKSSNRVKSQEVPVIVRVSDNEDPIIELTQNTETISCTDEVIKTFNPEDYIKTTNDNYYDVSVDIRILDNENGTEVSLNDIHNLYYDISDLNNIYSGDTETADGLSAWYEALNNIATKYSELDIDAERQYLIEYTVTENSEAKRSSQVELLLTITFDKNAIVSIINAENDKLQNAVDKYNAENPGTVVTTKPSNENGNSGNNSDNNDNNNGNTGNGNNGGGGKYTYKCPVCGAVYNSVDEANQCATTHFD
jgi:hypothetical protein